MLFRELSPAHSESFSYTVTGLRPWTHYEFSIRAHNPAGHTSSPWVTVTTKQAPPLGLAPPTVRHLKDQPSKLWVSWTPPVEPNGVLQSYRIQRNNVSFSFSFDPTVLNYTDEELLPFSTYRSVCLLLTQLVIHQSGVTFSLLLFFLQLCHHSLHIWGMHHQWSHKHHNPGGPTCLSGTSQSQQLYVHQHGHFLEQTTDTEWGGDWIPAETQRPGILSWGRPKHSLVRSTTSHSISADSFSLHQWRVHNQHPNIYSNRRGSTHWSACSASKGNWFQWKNNHYSVTIYSRYTAKQSIQNVYPCQSIIFLEFLTYAHCR